MGVKKMMGDIIRDGHGIICHQVNYHGVMGGGVAASIRDKLLSEEQYRDYQKYCITRGLKALGTVLYSETEIGLIANMFCQNEHFNNGLTNYACMEKCFKDIRTVAEKKQCDVCIPGYIGCGIAGGNWGKVREIIDRVFQESNVEALIIYWEKEL
ncbi:MAG: hypothetical protein IJI25_11050 [Eubacterium sp.]|nr:hypothetical protein [Eubacterium sp.]